MTSPSSEQSKYLSTLEDVASMIQKAQTNLKKCPKQRLTEGYVKTRLKCIEEYWETFKQAHYNLTKCTPREQRGVLTYFLHEEYYTYEDMYLCLRGDLVDLISSLESQQKMAEAVNMSTTSQGGQLPFAKLPRIQIPTFSGKYDEWPTFKDLFTALVHNTTISDVQKLHYLKTSVSGEAEALLRHIQITENNYAHAWGLLQARFGNKKMIVNSLLRRLFSQKRITNQTANHIKALLDTTMECLNSLNNMNVCTTSWDSLIVFLISQKLDPESLKEWEEQAYKQNSDELSTWDELRRFLESKFRTLELVTPNANSVREKTQGHKSFHVALKDDAPKKASTHSSEHLQPLCAYCNDKHFIYHCKEFASKPVEERYELVKKSNLCFNCLVPNHTVYNCKQKTSCRVCRRKHHSLLHRTKETSQSEDKQSQLEQRITTAHFSREQPGHQILLATAQIAVKASNGNTHLLRALIDQGSEASLVSARVVELLRLKKTCINGVVSGIGEESQIPIKHLVELAVSSRFDSNEVFRTKAYVMKTLSKRLPAQTITMNWPQLQTIKLADPMYNTPSRIDILLGADVFSKIIDVGLMRMPDGIVAQNTCLGWILSGQKEDISLSNEHKIITLHVTRMISEDDNILKRFWEIETDSYTKRRIPTREEEECETQYKNTTVRDEDGRYIVQLPLKQTLEETMQNIGDTKQMALRRFHQLENKFQRNEEFKRQYKMVIDEYLDMGHLQKCEDIDEEANYLPHHAVIRDDKDTTRLRVVFDASAKGTGGCSLNDNMLVGPILQPDLRSLIINWRKHKICVIGDIVKMYRMIRVAEEHTKLQHIVWRNEVNEDICSFRLKRVTFGTAAAPFLAVRTLNQLSDDEGQQYPEASAAIKHCFYMDDLMVSLEGVEEAKKLCSDLKVILEKGGFVMQKWSSNSEEVLDYLQAKENTTDTLEIKLDKIIKILGVKWDRKDDTFKVTVNLPELKYPITKRSILSDVARLFDPFGWLSPVVIVAKVMIQKLWLGKLGWDSEVPVNIAEEWIKYRKDLSYLQAIEVPRWFHITARCKEIQIHGFSDASSTSYAAVTYLRVIDEYNKVHVVMIACRTKVAPVKQLTIPRLELCAAVLLADLIKDVADVLKIPANNIYAYTDSTVVLSWLQSSPNRWRTFVGNRIADIQRNLEGNRWSHVTTTENPADIATRGVKAKDLAHLEMWWQGPKWLTNREIINLTTDVPATELEMKLSVHTHTYQKDAPLWERFSTLSRMKRVLAYCRRVLHTRNKEQSKDHLTVEEMESMLVICIKYYQSLVYAKEIEDIKNKGRVSAKSPLITLAPFLDERGILKVGGRLQNAILPDTTKYPTIIPKDVHIARLLIAEAHIRTCHGGNLMMMNYLRSKYWIIGMKSAVRKCTRTCKICIIDKAKTNNQMMGQLPAERVNPCRAFRNSGVDYAGPVQIRTSKGRGHQTVKGYICLFVCMSTKALHLEAVTDLTAQGFIAAFRRFIARRGPCLHLWSDNGTNFVGAAKELRELFTAGQANITKEIAQLLANDGTTWHFIPPRMPNYGGLWEAGVQSAKRHLTRMNQGIN
ncbi:uncharacterized protein LOC142977361 [Anticarsia gemmatalis]|uniref:uncharacterized protein LOC142977361 n=1 Tax=Anticarsia gemmatalis TaxID=129554 RepID=UPI003F767575